AVPSCARRQLLSRGRSGASGLPRTLAGGRTEAATSEHALPESFPLLGGHALPALGHATAEMRTTKTTASISAEADPTQRQKTQRLPEGDRAPAEERRQQPVPQEQHDFAADEGEQQHPQNRQGSDEYPSLS